MDEDAQRTLAAHRDYYLWLAEQATAALLSRDHQHWLDQLLVEDDNLRAALAWSRTQPDGAEALARLSAALQDYWAYTGRLREGWRWVEEALAEREQVSPRYRVRMLIAAGHLALDLADFAQAQALLDEALQLARVQGFAYDEALALSHQGYLAQVLGHSEAARTLHEAALAHWDALGDDERVADALTSLGIAALLLGDLPRAIALCEQSVARCRATPTPYYLTDALLALGFARFLAGDLAAARARLAEGLSLAETYATQVLLARGLDEVAFVAGMSGMPERAARLLGATTALRARSGAPMIAAYEQLFTQLLTALHGALGADAVQRLLEEGSALGSAEAVALALETVREPACGQGGDGGLDRGQ